MFNRIVTALNETTIAQLIITVLCIGASLYLVVTGQTVPEWLLGVDLLVVGFFFGTTARKGA